MLSQIFGSQIEDASPHDGVEETTEQHQDDGYLAVYQQGNDEEKHSHACTEHHCRANLYFPQYNGAE